MNRPSFQFYPADWKNNSKLRRCSEGARGAWMDILCLLHDSDEYGICRWPLEELARAAGVTPKYARELAKNNVLKGSESGECAPYVYVPRSGRKDGVPVTLVAAQPGPIWYSSRFVKDEYVRTHAGASTRFGASPSRTSSQREGEDQGDGSSSSSSSSSSEAKASYCRKAQKRVSYSPLFETFWEAYPRDDGMSKQEAFKSWTKLSEEDREKAINGIPGFKAWTAKQGSDYRILHACRYLSQGRFDGFAEKAKKESEFKTNRTYVQYGTDAGDEWERWYRERGKTPPRDGRGGWWFETEHPPSEQVA